MRLIKTLLILLLLQNTTFAFAQSKGSVQVNLNSITSNYLKDLGFPYFLTFEPKLEDRERKFATSFTYRTNSEKSISFGFNMGYDWVGYSETLQSGRINTKETTIVNAAGEMYIRYSKPNPKRAFYGMVGVGVERKTITVKENNTVTSSIKKNQLANQFTPIAFDCTIYKHWHGTVEMGYGYKGLISIGVRYKF